MKLPILAGALLMTGVAFGQMQSVAPTLVDTRQPVTLPEPMVPHLLADMRDHLAALEQVQTLLGQGDTAGAAKLAESRLGVSAQGKPGSPQIGRFVRAAMREIGREMHQSASRFANLAANVPPGGDLRPAIAALADVSRQCVGCHAGYRIR